MARKLPSESAWYERVPNIQAGPENSASMLTSASTCSAAFR